MISRRGGCVRHAGCVGEGLLVGERGIGVDLGRNNHGEQREKEIKEKVMREQVAPQWEGFPTPQMHQSQVPLTLS